VLRTLNEKIDPKHAALVVVDMQNDFCHPNSPFARKSGKDVSMAETMAPRLVGLIEAARAAGVQVIFTQDSHKEGNISDVQREEWLRTHARMNPEDEPSICEEGSWGEEFYEVSPKDGDLVVRKHRYSAFINTDLNLILRSNQIQSLIMTGVATGGCVESTARDGFMLDHYIVFVEDCCATSTVDRHNAAVAAIRDTFGVITTADEIMKAWSRVPAQVSAD
jgi:ureidoacrylate peracid hydrolase